MICYYADLKNHNFSPTLLVKKLLYLVNAQFLGLGCPSSRAHCDQESWPIFDFLIANERFFHKLQVLFISYWAVAWSCGWKLAKCRFLVIFRGVITQNHSITLIAIFSKLAGLNFSSEVPKFSIWPKEFGGTIQSLCTFFFSAQQLKRGVGSLWSQMWHHLFNFQHHQLALVVS